VGSSVLRDEPQGLASWRIDASFRPMARPVFAGAGRTRHIARRALNDESMLLG
jgi:hypothetical protein